MKLDNYIIISIPMNQVLLVILQKVLIVQAKVI